MAEMKDLNQMVLFMDLVVDENRGVDELTNLRPISSDVPHVGKPGEQIDVIEQGHSKAGSGFVVVLGYMPNYLGQIA